MLQNTGNEQGSRSLQICDTGKKGTILTYLFQTILLGNFSRLATKENEHVLLLTNNTERGSSRLNSLNCRVLKFGRCGSERAIEYGLVSQQGFAERLSRTGADQCSSKKHTLLPCVRGYIISSTSQERMIEVPCLCSLFWQAKRSEIETDVIFCSLITGEGKISLFR